MKTLILGLLLTFAFTHAARAMDPLVVPPKFTAPGAAARPKHAAEELAQISDAMKKAGQLLQNLQTGDPTQDEQKKALAQLDEIIARIPPQQGGGGSSQQQNQQQQQQQGNKPQDSKSSQDGSGNKTGQSPANESNIQRSVTVNPDAPKPNDQQKWGALPPAQRDALKQIFNENFLPQKYKNLIDLYWQKISETP